MIVDTTAVLFYTPTLPDVNVSYYTEFPHLKVSVYISNKSVSPLVFYL